MLIKWYDQCNENPWASSIEVQLCEQHRNKILSVHICYVTPTLNPRNKIIEMHVFIWEAICFSNCISSTNYNLWGSSKVFEMIILTPKLVGQVLNILMSSLILNISNNLNLSSYYHMHHKFLKTIVLWDLTFDLISW